MHTILVCLLPGLAAGLVATAGAATKFVQVTTSDAGGGNSRMETLVEGERFRSTFLESPEYFPAGCYLVGTGANQMFMVVPDREQYARMDPAEFQGMTPANAPAGDSAASEQMGQMQRTVEDLELKKEIDEAGPAMFGLTTRHYRYVLSYKEVMKMTGAPMAMTMTNHEVHEFWSTMDLPDGMGMSPMGGGPAAGGAGTEDVLRAAQATMDQHGMKLKSITTRRTTQGGMGGFARLGRGGNKSTSTSTQEIVAFETLDAPADAFALPENYAETDMMNLFAGGRARMPNLDGTEVRPGKPRKAMPDLN